MLEIILLIYIFIRAIACREYGYISVSVLSLLYFVFTAFLQNPDNLEYIESMAVIEKILLVALSAVLVYCAKPGKDGKIHALPAILAGIACVARFLRSGVFDWFTDKAGQPGADVAAISNSLLSCYNLMNVIVFGCLFFMLLCVAWQLSKKNILQV